MEKWERAAGGRIWALCMPGHTPYTEDTLCALAHIFPLGIMRRKTISTMHKLCDVTLVSNWVSTVQFQT